MANPTYSLKLTYKAALLIFLPLCLQLLCVAILLGNLGQTQQQAELEAQTGQFLAYMGIIFSDSLAASSKLVLYGAMKEKQFLQEFSTIVYDLRDNRDALARLKQTDTADSEEIGKFLSFTDDTMKLLMHAKYLASNSKSPDNIRQLAKIQTFLQQANSAGGQTIRQLTDKVTQKREQRSKSRDFLILAVEILSALNVAAAVICAFTLNAAFASRMKILLENTANIALGRALKKRLDGNDELAELDDVMHNMSEELVLARRKERAMIDNAAEIICSLDESLKIAGVNYAAVRILGFSQDEIKGKAIQSLIHPEDQKAAVDALEKTKSSYDDAIFEARMKTIGGDYLEMEWTSHWSRIEDSIFCIIHDIAERKKTERLKQDVLAMVSHDMRSSLNSLDITLELLSEGELGTLNEKGTSMVEKSSTSMQMLLEMIHEFLEVERIESRNAVFTFKQVKLNDLVTQALNAVSAEASKRNLQSIVNLDDVTVTVDPERFRRVFLNLITNAIKYSPNGGTITVRSRMHSEQNFIEVRIDDQGPGIPQDKTQFVFYKFKQLGRSEKDEREGTGLGLAICKAIVEAHGGKIGVQNLIDGGSSFWLTIPLEPTSAGTK